MTKTERANLIARIIMFLIPGLWRTYNITCDRYNLHKVPGYEMGFGAALFGFVVLVPVLTLLFIWWTTTMVDAVNIRLGSSLMLAKPRWTDSFWSYMSNMFAIIHFVAFVSISMAVVPCFIVPIRCGLNGFPELLQGSFNGVLVSSSLLIAMKLCMMIMKKSFPDVKVDYAGKPLEGEDLIIARVFLTGFLLGGLAGIGIGYYIDKNIGWAVGFVVGASIGFVISMFLYAFISNSKPDEMKKSKKNYSRNTPKRE